MQPSDQFSANETCTLHRTTSNPLPRNAVESIILPKQIVRSTSRWFHHQGGLAGTVGLSNTNTDPSSISSEVRIGKTIGDSRTGVGVS